MSKKTHGFQIKEDTKINLPTSEESFDKLVDELVARYKLPDKEHAAAVVANRIMHMPPDQATTTLRYLGHCVLKNIAYQIAQAKGSKIAHKHQIDDIVAELTTNPMNQEARDAIEQAASSGSEYAKEKLEALGLPLITKTEEATTDKAASSDDIH